MEKSVVSVLETRAETVIADHARVAELAALREFVRTDWGKLSESYRRPGASGTRVSAAAA